MSDEMLERRLRAALRSEVDTLGMTITPAELERRLALRRRGRPGRLAAFALAAAVGVGLMGIAGAAAGLFDRDPTVPSQPSPRPSTSPAPGETEGTSVILLPSLDDILARLDPATIVRAQSVGPEDGPSASEFPGPRTVRLAPLTVGGAIRVYTACRGPVEATLDVRREPGAESGGVSIPVACDGRLTERQILVGAGNLIEFKSPGPASWRLVVETEPRAAWHATSLEAAPGPDDGQSLLVEGSSQRSEPSYEPDAGGPPSVERIEVGAIAPRTSYRVSVACAGPSPISVVFAGDVDGKVVDVSTTEVECDGAFHADELHLPLPDGGVLSVTADPRNAWQIAVSSDTPPIGMEPDRSGWQLAIATGPDLDFRGAPLALSSTVDQVDHRIRVVVSCFGGTGVDVVVHAGGLEAAAVGSFRAPCQPNGAITTSREFDLPDSAFTVQTDPDGMMWLAVTVQQPAGSPDAP